MKEKIVTALKVFISLGLMVGLFYWFLSKPDTRDILLTSFADADYRYWFVALVFFALAVISDAVKWQILLKAQGVLVPFKALTIYTFMGTFFTNFLPSNVGGEVVRGFYLARYTDRVADAAVSLVVNRIIGLIAFMFSAVVAALLAVQLISRGLIQGGIADNEALVQNLTLVQIAAVLMMLVIVGLFAVMLSHRLRLFIGKLFTLKLLKPLGPIYQQLSDAFGSYRYQYKALLIAFLVGLANPLLTGLVDVAIIAGLKERVDPLYIFLFNPIIAFLLIVPISIGGLGTGSLLYVGAYGLVGVPATTAFALSVIKQLVIYLSSLPGGVLWWQKQKKGPGHLPPAIIQAE